MSALGRRPRQCPVELLQPGDVIAVYVCIENDEYDWVERTVVVVGESRLTLRCPGGWEKGRVYSVRIVPGEKYRLAYVDMPLLREGDDS